MTVYVIGERGSGIVKIGYTSDLPQRLSSLQKASPVRLEVLAHWSGDQVLERRLHRAFAQNRIHGEWFEFPDGTDPVPLIEAAMALPWEPAGPPAGIQQRVMELYETNPEFRALMDEEYGPDAPSCRPGCGPWRVIAAEFPELRDLLPPFAA